MAKIIQTSRSAILRAMATLARFEPRRLATSIPQRLSFENRFMCAYSSKELERQRFNLKRSCFSRTQGRFQSISTCTVAVMPATRRTPSGT